ncbi:hypothetical protein UFOVP1305_18 [uncultured Caudovirales phage]|uniref:Uncharacterized protein n=1 Tax=uncultured Caudovirales phage TaxID=2100421 RepID=A0A6J5PKF3_9CAUD|nr:hypothetical protein UFOVP896_56 [uncultured Caudovirales phage]CAB4197513.1 hypothetical protein UFOVP1305_18 [uncultured Caudovirales phage]
MNREDFGTLWKMLTGVWSRLDTDETVAAWWGLLAHYPAHHAQSAVRGWATDHRNAPTPADIIAGIKMIAAETQRQQPVKSISGSVCQECESVGFVFISLDGHGTVKRCSRGCMPRAGSERLSTDREKTVDREVWVERFHQHRARLASERSSMSEHEYLVMRGYEPDLFKITEGMIVRRSTVRR